MWGAPLGIGRLWRGIRGGISRLSLRLVSTTLSPVSFVIVTFFAFGIVFGIIALSVVSFYFSSLAFGVGPYRGCGGFVALVFSYAFGVGSSFARRFRV